MAYYEFRPLSLLSSKYMDDVRLNFDLPEELEAGAPAEARGLARDQVRLMVSYRSNNSIIHTQFRDIVDFLLPGDALIINTSGTLNAAIAATCRDGTALELHLSTRLAAALWIVEVRTPSSITTQPYYGMQAGESLQLPGGATVTLHVPYRHERSAGGSPRLWIASLDLPLALDVYLETYGFPIRYSYVKEGWPSSYYQTVYATEKGSAEMPSAGRAFTCELITRLIGHGIRLAPLLLHTGVASVESHEPPYAEYYRVPFETAQLVNMTRNAGGRVIAVGTTVVRALETVTDGEGITHAGAGWTDIVITPQRGIHAVNAMLTGLHEPRATHLAMLEALAGLEHLQVAYQQALQKRYLWHEFGDLHLILP